MFWQTRKTYSNHHRSLGVALLLFVCTLLNGCGESASLDLSEKFTVAMLGVFEAPADAEGNAEPRSLSFTLQSVALTSAEGASVALYEDEPKEFSIINRSQIIAEADIAEYVGQAFTAVTVTFSAAVTAVARTSSDLPITLPSPALVHTAPIAVSKAKSHRLNIGVLWKNIVTYDDSGETPVETVSAPGFSFELRND